MITARRSAWTLDPPSRSLAPRPRVAARVKDGQDCDLFIIGWRRTRRRGKLPTSARRTSRCTTANSFGFIVTRSTQRSTAARNSSPGQFRRCSYQSHAAERSSTTSDRNRAVVTDGSLGRAPHPRTVSRRGLAPASRGDDRAPVAAHQRPREPRRSRRARPTLPRRARSAHRAGGKRSLSRWQRPCVRICQNSLPREKRVRSLQPLAHVHARRPVDPHRALRLGHGAQAQRPRGLRHHFESVTGIPGGVPRSVACCVEHH